MIGGSRSLVNPSKGKNSTFFEIIFAADFDDMQGFGRISRSNVKCRKRAAKHAIEKALFC